MITAKEFVSAQLKTLQNMQYVLCLAESAAASHRLKSHIKGQITGLDELENHFQNLSMQRGWEITEIEPFRKFLTSASFRPHQDADIAEYLIRRYNRDSIELLKLNNRLEREDAAIRNLFQKLLDQYTIGIRQLHHFL